MVKKITKPNENDVLLGRGGKNNQWVGNEKLRNLARGRCHLYQVASKKEKSQISRALVGEVRQMKPQGRFLRKCIESSNEWEDVGDEIAREKASQVLRDAIQAKKSFLVDHDNSSLNDTSPIVKKRGYDDTKNTKEETPVAKSRRKDPPCRTEEIPVQQSFPSGRRKPIPTLVERKRRSLHEGYQPAAHVYSSASMPMQHPYSSYGRVTRAPLNNVSISSSNYPKEKLQNFELSSIPYQYPVTPSSAMIAPALTRKRSRYCQESPLVHGFHRYPYPTPIRCDANPGTPSASIVFTPTPKSKVRGLTFSPPNPRANGSPSTRYEQTDHSPSSTRCISTFKVDPTLAPSKIPYSDNQNSDYLTSSSTRCISTLKTTEKDRSRTNGRTLSPRAPIQDSKPSIGTNGGGSSQDFHYLFNEDVLSDSAELQDDLIF